MQSLKIQFSECLSSPETVGELEVIFSALNERLVNLGISLYRASTGMMTMHPEIYGKQLIWQINKGTKSILRSHAIIASSLYQNSPPAYVRRKKKKLHINLEVPKEELEHDVCRELQEEGATDYLILPLKFRNGLHSFVSWATLEKGGFKKETVDLLESITPWISLRLELACSQFATESLLHTYLGKKACQRVLSGSFKKGSGESIRAVIWVCDLRGFTQMVDSSAIDIVLENLDRYFSCVAKPIIEQGGEVLKYIGDAVLGVFPIDDIGDETNACNNALSAVAHAFQSLENVNEQQKNEGKIEIKFGIALHVGEIIYGNIGTEGRLDFTVIGRAVNEVCRVEAMCKELNTVFLVTQKFINISKRANSKSLGQYSLRGVEEKHELYTFDISTLQKEFIKNT